MNIFISIHVFNILLLTVLDFHHQLQYFRLRKKDEQNKGRRICLHLRLRVFWNHLTDSGTLSLTHPLVRLRKTSYIESVKSFIKPL